MSLHETIRRVTNDDLPGTVRALDQGDLEACLTLALDRGWPDEVAKWRFLLDVGDGFGIDAPGGGLAAAVIVTHHDPGLAVIGMFLVAARYGRRGLGRRLMGHALDHAAGRIVYLFATPQGRPLYDQMGFEVVDSVTKHLGEYRPAPPPDSWPSVRRPVPADGPAVLRLDREAFGADRSVILGRLAAFADVVVAEEERRLVGHAAAWPSRGGVTIGPVVARDDAVAEALVHRLAVGAVGPVRLDLTSRFKGLSRWAQRRGLSPVTREPLMVLGGRALPGERERLYAPLLQSVG
jgi:predicted N-acetyltransferase YhbS